MLALALLAACKGGEQAPRPGELHVGDRVLARTTPVRDVELGARCLGLAGAELVEQACPAIPAGTRQLAVWVQRDKLQVGLTVADEINEIGERKMLEGVLRNQHRAAAFRGRTDLALAVAPDFTLADVVELLEIAHAAGFGTARWVAPDALPMPLATR